MITPAEYFAKHPNACRPAQEFCAQFPTMRDAWMSDDVKVRWMLWVAGRDPANAARVVEFAKGCAAFAATFASAKDAAETADASASAWAAISAACADADAYADAADAADYAADAAARAATATADAAESAERQRQRNHLRALFPRMFID